MRPWWLRMTIRSIGVCWGMRGTFRVPELAAIIQETVSSVQADESRSTT